MRSVSLVGWIAAAVALSLLAGCGSGNGNRRISDSEIEDLRLDPRVQRLEDISATADTLLIPSLHVAYSLEVEGSRISDRDSASYSCSGIRCRSLYAEDIDLIESFTTIEEGLDDIREVDIESRGGFTFARLQIEPNLEEPLAAGMEIREAADQETYGLWGRYGYAAVHIFDGRIVGTFEDIPFEGVLSGALPTSLGSATGTNPTGIGGARWTGFVEAVSPRSFERYPGTATVSIADLSNPRVTVQISIKGYEISEAAWVDMPLSAGRFGAGSRGRDYLEGNFHGPAHEETYGVFDTGTYIGAFGANQ